jgi:hypothetical protein
MTKYLHIICHARRGNNASMIFRKDGAEYRIATVQDIRSVMAKLSRYANDFIKDRADEQFILELHCPKGCNRVLEIAIEDSHILFHVFEFKGDDMELKFFWRGQKENFRRTVQGISMLSFFLH